MKNGQRSASQVRSEGESLRSPRPVLGLASGGEGNGGGRTRDFGADGVEAGEGEEGAAAVCEAVFDL